jgi:hypothetical protein
VQDLFWKRGLQEQNITQKLFLGTDSDEQLSKDVNIPPSVNDTDTSNDNK